MPLATTARRLLRSPVVDLLVGPHGVDRYLELIRPDLTVYDARAEIVRVDRQTPRSVTLTIRPNAAWTGFQRRAVRPRRSRDRRRSPDPDLLAGELAARAREQLELTISFLPDGLVSSYLRSENPGGSFTSAPPAGSSCSPTPGPTLVLISGGSGVTPVMSMLRTLREERADTEIDFIHYARTRDEWLYRSVLDAMPDVRSQFIATREGGAHFGPETVPGADDETVAAVCGPPRLIDAVKQSWPGPVLSETFTPPTLELGASANGTIRFLQSETQGRPDHQPASLLEQAEAAGLSPEFGCRMGICHTCTCRKTAGRRPQRPHGRGLGRRRRRHPALHLCP